MKKLLMITLLLVGAIGLKAQENDPKLLQIVENLGDQMERLVVAKDIDPLVAMYGEDAQYLPDQGRIYTGLDEIRKVWEMTFRVDVLEFELSTDKVRGDKKRIIETGSGSSKVSFNGQESVQTFKFVNVWERQKNGEYKLVVDIYNRGLQGT